MIRQSMAAVVLALVTSPASSAFAGGIDSLQGQFAFNWHMSPSKTRCAAVDSKLLSLFKSNAFKCELDVITNTASGEPARVCTQIGDGAEYLVFLTRKACEDERLTQASNEE
jgi:hypothetical protein